MNIKHSALYAAMFSALIGLAGCSGGSSSSTPANVSGRITGFGSVYVNGVEYETNGTDITIDGVPATEADLHVGMIVNLSGSDDGTNGTALSISFTDELEGFVTQTVSGGGLIVMGHTITTDSQTNFEGLADITALALGDVVEVSGYPDANGDILATFIELKNYTSGDEVEVKGLVAGLDTNAMTFTIGAMTVDYSSASSVDAGLADGAYVEVKGDSAPVAGVFTATKVEAEQHGVDGSEGENIEVEGLITDIDTTAGTISVNGQTFTLPTGFDVSQYAVGDMVEIEVTVNGNDLIVSEIGDEDHDGDNANKIEVRAQVTVTNTVAKTLTIAGITITVNPNTTIMIDHSAVPNQFFNLGSIIENSDVIKVEAIPDGAGGYSATRIERTASTSTVVEIEGPAVVDGTSGAITIAGVTLDVNTNSIDTAAVAGSTKVEAQGTMQQNGSLLVTALQAE
jgi:hypothetical protein